MPSATTPAAIPSRRRLGAPERDGAGAPARILRRRRLGRGMLGSDSRARRAQIRLRQVRPAASDGRGRSRFGRDRHRDGAGWGSADRLRAAPAGPPPRAPSRSRTGRPASSPSPWRPRRRSPAGGRANGVRRRRRLEQVRVDQRHLGVLLVRGIAGQTLVEHAAERVDVRAPVELLALDLLRRGVLGRADEHPGSRDVRGLLLRDAEVGEVDVVGAVRARALDDQHVRGLHVPVHEAHVVRGAQSGWRSDRSTEIVAAQSSGPVRSRSCLRFEPGT